MMRIALAAFLLVVTPVHAEVRLPRVVGSRMVLQRDSEVRIWGWADVGERVRITGDWFDGGRSTAADDGGHWAVTLPTGPAGGPHLITIEGENTIRLDDVLFGEVWLASGQSNMEMPVVAVSNAYTGIQNADEEVAAANHPEIRLFQVGNFSSIEPLEDVESGIVMYGVPAPDLRWHRCSPESVPTFSSTAYFFARELHKQLDVPIGIIDASWGGTSAEAWTPLDGLKHVGLDAEAEQAVTLAQKADQKIPSRLYNGMIHPLRQFRIKGVIWYQGEGNATRAGQYHELFSTMIRSWREAFGETLPFYFVQISPFNYRGVNAAFLREAQRRTLSLPHTGMVVTMDIGNLTDIHPKNKQEVGRRLALWALAGDYDVPVVFSGPIMQSHEVDGDTVRIGFDHIGGGLTTNDGKSPSHFEVAGEDRVFHPAEAIIDGDEIVVRSDEVSQPRAVRYGFTSTAMPNVVNREGLPASPFRTDEW